MCRFWFSRDDRIGDFASGKRKSAGNGERNQARQRATKQTAEPRAVEHEVRPVPPVSQSNFAVSIPYWTGRGYVGVPLFETKAAKYLKNVRGTICDSQVVENPETDRPNPAQVMHEVQPSRLLPIQISTFDYPEQAMRISGRTPSIFVTKVFNFSDLFPKPRANYDRS